MLGRLFESSEKRENRRSDRRADRQAEQRQITQDAAGIGLNMLGPERDRYELQGLGAMQSAGRMGMFNERQLLGELSARSAGDGYGAGSAMLNRAGDSAAMRARGDALSVSGVNPAAAAAMANQNAAMSRAMSAGQAGEIAAQEQQFADQMRASLASGMAGRGLNASQVQLGANQAYDANRLGAASAFINPLSSAESQARMAEEQRRAARDQALIGGVLNAGGGALGGWLGG